MTDTWERLARDMYAHMTRPGCEGCAVKSRCDDGLLEGCIVTEELERRMRELERLER